MAGAMVVGDQDLPPVVVERARRCNTCRSINPASEFYAGEARCKQCRKDWVNIWRAWHKGEEGEAKARFKAKCKRHLIKNQTKAVLAWRVYKVGPGAVRRNIRQGRGGPPPFNFDIFKDGEESESESSSDGDTIVAGSDIELAEQAEDVIVDVDEDEGMGANAGVLE